MIKNEVVVIVSVWDVSYIWWCIKFVLHLKKNSEQIN